MTCPSPLFWKNKTILITGHTGFKGSWLSLWLTQLGANVIGFALPPPTEPNLFTLANVSSGMTSIIGDIRDFSSLLTLLKNHQPEIIIHMAAQPLVLQSYDEPIETYETNVMGTVHLLEAARQTQSVKAIVNVTTDKCYENKEWHWGYRENDRLGGYDPYSNSKACSELVTSAYRDSYFRKMNIGLASARAGNVIGGGDWAKDRLIPSIIDSLFNQQPLSIRHPQALRPWQHVLEPLRGYLLLAQKLYEAPDAFAEAWNFGPTEEDIQPVKWIVEYAEKKWAKPSSSASWVLDNVLHPHEACYLKLDFSKAKSRLGWKPQWNLGKGLDQTIEWYQAYYSKNNMFNITMGQIIDYMKFE